MNIATNVDIWSKLKITSKPILIYGMGDGALKIIEQLELRGIEISGVFANDEFVRGHSFNGHKVLKLAEVVEKFGDNFIGLMAFAVFQPEWLDRVYSIADKYEIYAPDIPVISDGVDVFDYEYYLKHKDELQQIYDRLEDEISKKTLENCINFKLTGDINYLTQATTPVAECYDLINPKSSDVYVDLGAYNGDTIEEFMSYTDGNNIAYAIEPDTRNFKKLTQRVENNNYTNVKCYKNVASNDNNVYQFNAKGGRSARLNDTSKTIDIHGITVDGLLDGARVDVIKYDVEGAEVQAILGCKQTIIKHKPRLMVSAYHKIDDLFNLPNLINSFRDDYKIYLRHHPYIPCWETNFYFI